LFFLLPYPFITIYYAIGTPLRMFVWLALGVVVLELLRRFRRGPCAKLWFALWFMPGTIICGAGTLYPWPFAAYQYWAYRSTMCSTPLSLLICLALNLAVVFGGLYFVRRRRETRADV
jgi:hypothetical protein